MPPYAILLEKLCDNYPECPAMKNCTRNQGAIYLNEHKKISIDMNKCIACKQCINYCGLFRIAKSITSEQELRLEFAKDPRTNEFYQSIERFGCDTFNTAKYQLYTTNDIDAFITASPRDQLNILEFVDDNNLLCPFQGVSVEEILSAFPERLREYRKYVVKSIETDAVYSKYRMDDFPVILLLRDGNVVHAIYGRYRANSVNEERAMFAALRKAFADAIEKVFADAIE